MSCRDDKFWTAVWNTARFVVLQVTLMTTAAMITALILNREIRARGFWRAVFFFPVLLSPGRRRPDLALDPAAPGPAQLARRRASASTPSTG